MQTERITYNYQFTDAEARKFGRQQAELLDKKDELDAQLKAAKTQIQSQIDGTLAEIRGVSSRIRSGFEIRHIDCLVMDHRRPGMRYLVRTDNGHVASARRLSASERQMTITDEPPKNYVAIARLKVDDKVEDADFIDLHVFAAEFDTLRGFPDVAIIDLPLALIDDQAGNEREAGAPSGVIDLDPKQDDDWEDENPDDSDETEDEEETE